MSTDTSVLAPLRSASSRLLALLLSVQVVLALQVGAYFREHSGGVFEHVGRGPVILAIGLQLVLALALFARDPSAGFLLWAGPALGLVTLTVSCPFNDARVHALQVALLLACGVLALRRSWRASRLWVVRLALLAMVGLVTEGAFSLVARSHAVGYSLAARLWYERYWGRAANSDGYRDVEHPDDGRPKLFVLGDSFVAGVGIADVSERFSERLQALVPAVQVHNLGWNGADTKVELERLALHRARPDILVLSYYVNDIEGAAEELGLPRPELHPYSNLPLVLARLVSRSYALDYLYWQFPQSDLAGLGGFLARCYAWPEAVERQKAQLVELIDWARARGTTVLAVAFPELERPDGPSAGVELALEVFRAEAVPCVDVRELVRGHAPAELVVNRNDAHPNAWLHARVAEALVPLVEQVLEQVRPAVRAQ